MAAPNAQIVRISPDQERAILMYANKAHTLLLNQFSLRTNLEMIDRYYMREKDFDEKHIQARLASRAGAGDKIEDITVPIVMPQVEAALGYMVNVFLTGYPIFGVTADPATEDAALQMETIIAENAITAGWARQLMMFFRDGLKYNLHAVECEWQQKTVATVETDAVSTTGSKVKSTLWTGNVIKRMDLYNTFFDPRVSPAEIAEEGEYAGYISMMSRVRMKKYINDLFGKISVDTALRAFQSSPSNTDMGSSMGTPFSYFQPVINPYPIMSRQNQQTFDWMAWAEASMPKGKNTIRYTNVYEVMKLYARIIPADFGFRVPEENTPQVWKFIIVNGTVVLYGEKQGNAHNYIPMFFGQPLEDGLDFQTKSFASNVSDMQDIASAMWNGYIKSKRRLVGDRVLYDPMRVREKDINSTNPAAKIPVRPSAYGKTVAESVYQFPFRDEQTRSLIEGAEMVTKYADLINGQNPAQRGQFVKGNKTKHEYEDIMGHGNTTNQSMAIMSEAQVFTPLKETVKLNILQYQEEATLYNRDKNQQVQVDPVELRKAAIHFKVSDGITPADKEMSTDEFQTALQTVAQVPAIGSAYNIGPMFTYLMKIRGADLRPFEKSPVQQQYEQQLQAWQQAAAMAAQKGTAFNTPMPQVPPELQAQQQQQQSGRPQPVQSQPVPPSQTGRAEESTQGANGRPPIPATGRNGAR